MGVGGTEAELSRPTSSDALARRLSSACSSPKSSLERFARIHAGRCRLSRYGIDNLARLVASSGMAEGTIKRLTDKGFGFIANASGKDLFFHMSAVEGVRFEDLREGQKVSYNEGMGPKGPRAENVRPI